MPYQRSSSARLALSMALYSRPLRGTERAAILRGDVAVALAELDGPVSANILQQASVRLQRRYPSLRARCRGSTTDPIQLRLEVCEPDPHRLVFEEQREEPASDPAEQPAWLRFVEEQLNSRFIPEDGFMFRVEWIPRRNGGGHVLVSVASALMDERSVLQVLSELLYEYARLAQAPELPRHSYRALETLLVPPALLDVSPPTLRERCAHALESVARSLRADWEWSRRSGSAAAGRPPATCQFSASSRDATLQALAAARAHDVSLNCMVSAAAQFALVCELRDQGILQLSSRPSPLAPLLMSFNLRDQLRARVSTEQQGSLHGVAHLSVVVSEQTTFWQLAVQLQAESRRRSRLSVARRQELDAETADRAPATLVRSLKSEDRTHPLVHVGCNTEQQLTSRLGLLTVAHVHVAQRSNLIATPLDLRINVFDERLHYSLTSNVAEVERPRLQRMLRRIRGLIEGAVAEPAEMPCLGAFCDAIDERASLP